MQVFLLQSGLFIINFFKKLKFYKLLLISFFQNNVCEFIISWLILYCWITCSDCMKHGFRLYVYLSYRENNWIFKLFHVYSFWRKYLFVDLRLLFSLHFCLRNRESSFLKSLFRIFERTFFEKIKVYGNVRSVMRALSISIDCEDSSVL